MHQGEFEDLLYILKNSVLLEELKGVALCLEVLTSNICHIKFLKDFPEDLYKLTEDFTLQGKEKVNKFISYGDKSLWHNCQNYFNEL